MTAVLTTSAPVGAARVGALPVPVVLGLQEGRRIVVHPVTLLGLALLAFTTAQDPGGGARWAFDVATVAPIFFCGVFVYFSAHLVASRDRRARSGELLAALPAPASTRVAALCVAAFVPALACAALVIAFFGYCTARGLYVEPPSVWHLSQGPLTVLGGALLGTMVARLAPVPGVALVVMVAMFAANGWLSERDDVQLLGTLVSWPVWDEGEGWHGVQPGSAAWHAAYLASLCAMAATGAFLRETRNRLRVLCVGAVCTASAVVTGLLQLP